jgi:hypothetical protein
MAKCKACNAEISFKEHPTTPGKWLPVNADGVVHFKTCKKPRVNTFKALAEIKPCKLCNSPAKYVYKKLGEKSKIETIGVRCVNLHFMSWIPKVKENFALVNITEENVDQLRLNQIELNEHEGGTDDSECDF